MMQTIDEAELETNLAYRFRYLSDFIGFDASDAAAVLAAAPFLGPQIPQLVEATYERLLKYDATARHFLPRQSGYDGPLPADIGSLTAGNPQIQFRKEHLSRYFMQVLGRSCDERMVPYLDMVGKIHTPAAGNAEIDVPLVQMNALMGLISDIVADCVGSAGLDPATLARARQEMFIAEGSDWCWWYGPHHESANRAEFDQLYRDHLSNVYRLLGQPAPEELGRPILKLSTVEHNIRPASQIQPVIDGEVTSYFEWMGAGEYKVDHRQGAMHGGRSGLEMLYYGTCGEEFYIRCDFDPMPEPTQLEIRVKTQRGEYTLHRKDFAAADGLRDRLPERALARRGRAGEHEHGARHLNCARSVGAVPRARGARTSADHADRRAATGREPCARRDPVRRRTRPSPQMRGTARACPCQHPSRRWR